MSFPTLISLWLQHCSVSLHKASPPHTYTPYSSFCYNPLHLLITSSPCLFQRKRSSKKMRQTGCRQHPATALCASCVWGIRSTRSGSHTTHRLNTSFRFSTLAFKPCYQRWLKAVFTKKIRFKPASPTPAPDHPPQIFGAVGFLLPYQADSNINHNIIRPSGNSNAVLKYRMSIQLHKTSI